MRTPLSSSDGFLRYIARARGRYILRAVAVAGAIAGLASGARAEPHHITLPAETSVLARSDLPGYGYAGAFCATCHSVDYARYQPPGMPRAFWATEVTKMQKTFGAPIPDQFIDPIVDYLVKVYGSDTKPASPAAPNPAPAPSTAGAPHE